MNALQRSFINDRAVRRLVNAHVNGHAEPLLLAVRYKLDSSDVYLLEVLDGFPGAAKEPPFTSEFAPSAELQLLGKLHLTLANREQFLRAIGPKATALGRDLRAGRLEYVSGDARDLAEKAGLELTLSASELTARKALTARFTKKPTKAQSDALLASWGARPTAAKG